LTNEIIITGYSLPINLEYKDVIRVEWLANPNATRVSSAALEFHPYFIFEYTLDITRKDPVGRTHPVKSKGIHIVDALNGRFLSDVVVLYHKDDQSIENQGAGKDGEIRQLIIDLTTIEPVINEEIVLNGDYETNIIDDKISMKTAERKVLEKVVLDNTHKASYYVHKGKGKEKEQKIRITPRFSEIVMKRRSLTYIPKWIITIKAGERTYNRIVLATYRCILFSRCKSKCSFL
jgi:hypothetical protein